MTPIEDVQRQIRQQYGDDIAQEAFLLTWERAPEHLEGYYRTVARALWRTFYHDGKIASLRHHRTRGREQLGGEITEEEGIDEQDPMWASYPGVPPRVAAAREALRALPLWVIEMHLEYDMTWENRCRHPVTNLKPNWVGGKPYVRCSMCRMERRARTSEYSADSPAS